MRIGPWLDRSEDQQTNFYKTVTGLSANATVDTLSRLLETVSHESHVDKYDNHGERLPLSVWVSRGWDKDAVLRSARHNRKDDTQFGELFRIYVQSDGISGSRGTTTKDKVSGAVDGAFGSGSASSSAAAPLAIKDKSSSSSSSSSWSRRRKKAKKKKSKKDKKNKKDKKKSKKHKKDKKRGPDAAEDSRRHTPALEGDFLPHDLVAASDVVAATCFAGQASGWRECAFAARRLRHKRKRERNAMQRLLVMP